MSFGIYIHFPFCRRRCGYCDFSTEARADLPHRQYAEAVLAELAAKAPLFAGRTAGSIYFGGGTPGLWEPACVGQVIDELSRSFSFTAAPEITLEANPGELSLEHLKKLRALGINRLSLGVQSLSDLQLARLGRIHNAAQVCQVVEQARQAGFTNLSLDLMFALPGESLEDLMRDAADLLALAPDHVSLYCLSLSGETPMGKALGAGKIKLPGKDVEAEMYEWLCGFMSERGFEHYEISNFARPGRRAVHNMLYWSGGEWLGLGAFAHSMRFLSPLQAERSANLGTAEYLNLINKVGATHASPCTPGPVRIPEGDACVAPTMISSPTTLAEREILDADALASEAMWLGLRRVADGIDGVAYQARFGFTPRERFGRVIDDLLKAGLLQETPARLRLTRRGILLADEVALRFI